MQRDPMRYINGPNLYAYQTARVYGIVDPSGTKFEYEEGCDEEFKKLVEKTLDELEKNTNELARLIKKLREDKEHVVRFRKSVVNHTGPPKSKSDDPKVQQKEYDERSKDARTPGKGTDSVVGWKPDNKNLRTGPENERPNDPGAGLAHELGHAAERAAGDVSDETGKGGAPKAEEQAVRMENEARYHYGIEQRTQYDGKKLDDPGPWPPPGVKR